MSNHGQKRSLLSKALHQGIRDIDELRQVLNDHKLDADDDFIHRRVKQFDERVADSKRPKVYVDGSYEFGKMGIGVLSKDLDIQISESASGGTNNVAKCLAVIRGCEECKDRGISGINVFSDSQLVVYWTSGRYRIKSETARRHVPRIRELIIEVDARLRWIPGVSNPADALSRGQSSGSVLPLDATMLEIISTTPMEDLRFRHFVKLKCGWDEFSSIRLPKLIERVDNQVYEAARTNFDDDKLVASYLRWHLRGLPIDKAIRKVVTDFEISENFRESRRKGKK